MIAYLIRRVGSVLLTLWLALTLAFIALRLIPGDAIAAQLAHSSATSEQIAARRAALGLDQPLIVQYVQTFQGLLRGDLGQSIATNRPVIEMIGEQFGATVSLAIGAMVVAVVSGVGLGIVAVAGRSRFVRRGAALVMALLLSSPVYWSGTLAIYVFSVGLRLLPSSGSGDVEHLILPWSVLGLSIAGSIARVAASSLNDLRRADFIRTARAKGQRESRVVLVHLLRAGITPILAVIALQTGFLLGGAVITEMLFVRQGIGRVLLSAINDKDFPVVQGIVILSAVTYSLVNTAADLLIAVFDPRVRIGPAAS